MCSVQCIKVKWNVSMHLIFVLFFLCFSLPFVYFSCTILFLFFFCLLSTFNNYCAIVRNLLQLNGNQSVTNVASAPTLPPAALLVSGNWEQLTKIVYMLNCAWQALSAVWISTPTGRNTLRLLCHALCPHLPQLLLLLQFRKPFGYTFWVGRIRFVCATIFVSIVFLLLFAKFCFFVIYFFGVVVSSCGWH